MLKVSIEELNHMESQHPGIIKEIFFFENATLPSCPYCGSKDTADVRVGIIGKTIYIATATTKFTIVANGPKPGNYRCNACKKYFNADNQAHEADI